MVHSQSPRIGILMNSESPLSARWAKPFEGKGFDITYIASKQKINVDKELSALNGLFLPGGDAHIHPFFVQPHTEKEIYAEDEIDTHYDFRRDLTAIDLVQKAFALNLPTLGICRGMHEMIAAYGGKLEKLKGELHAKNYRYAGDFERMSKPVHDIRFLPEGRLRLLFKSFCDEDGRIAVNSIHYEGITQDGWNSLQSTALRKCFAVESVAPDGVVEAISGVGKTFFVAVQAHLELRGPLHNPLFNEFETHIVEHYEKTI